MEDEKKQGLESLFVTYEQGLALKELGFDEDCFAFHSTIYGLVIGGASGNSVLYESAGECLAPLKQQVFKFFREEYNIDSHIEKYISSEGDDEYFYMADDVESINFKTYEEAENACIDKLIEIIKNK